MLLNKTVFMLYIICVNMLYVLQLVIYFSLSF